jgi:CheY-like chemotaxis protein
VRYAPDEVAKQILLVEDEPTLQRILGSVLTDAGERVDSVATAEQAIERLARGDVDLVLSDKNLPAMNGLDLLGRVRAIETASSRSIGFVLVTGYPSKDSALAVLAGDGDGYLVKPFRSLAQVVERAQAVLAAPLLARRAAARAARAVAQVLAGVPGAVSTPPVVLLVDGAPAEALRSRLTDGGAWVRDPASLVVGAPCAAVATRVESLVSFAGAHPQAALVLLDDGTSFAELCQLIDCGGGAVVAAAAWRGAAA